MYYYISPILGYFTEDLYETLVSSVDFRYDVYLKIMKETFGYSFLRSGVLLIESHFKDRIVNGSDIYNFLLGFGFSETISYNLMKLFSTNNRLIERLVEEGFTEDSVVYGMSLEDRLRHLGLVSATTLRKYAYEDRFVVHKIMEVYVPPEPPVHLGLYRSQGTYTYTMKGKRAELRIWYQSNEKISEDTLITKWNEANDNAIRLPSSSLGGLLDALEPDPGFEINHEIEVRDLVGEKNKWYGVLLFRAAGREYTYNIL